VKRAVKVTKVGLAGRITDPLLAEQLLRKEQVDYVGMTRALIADPELPRKAFEGRLEDIRPCIGTLEGCWGRSVGKWDAVREWPMRCTVNPSVGRENERGAGRLREASVKKKILIVGGGPAGLETARVASSRGHQVVIYEKNVLGGQLNLAKRLPRRGDVGAIIGWYETQLKKNRVRVELHLEVPAELDLAEYLVRKEKPDVVVLATGSSPVRTGIQMITFREIPGWNQPHVRFVDDILLAEDAMRGDVVVADATTYIEGPCVSELLATRGLKVTLVTPHPQLAPELGYYNQSIYYAKRLMELGVRVLTYSWVKRIEERSVTVYRIPTGTDEKIEADHVVLNTGRQQNGGLKPLFAGLVKEVYEIGDSNIAGGRARAAIEAGYQIGSTV
jgi:thioredoxin reductase